MISANGEESYVGNLKIGRVTKSAGTASGARPM
jgi:hypothetical protein